MGVQGLWQVLEPAGRPVNVNSLRGKVLAVDVSIWLHQLVKGYRDKDGNPLPNAHLLGVFHRVCKLLHYGIKPVFVFDGGVPYLKQQTLALRKKQKIEALDKSEEFRQKLLSNYVRQQLQRQIKKALPPTMRMEGQIAALSSKSRTPSPKKKPRGDSEASASGASQSQSNEDVFAAELQAFRDKFAARVNDDEDANAGGGDPEVKEESESSDDDDYGRSYGMDYSENFSAIVSSDFDTLPLETQHEILFEMQESRKMNSWGRIEQMPQSLQDFSSYQMDRLVKRRFLQKKIQSVQQEMGQRHIHVQNLDELLKMDYNFDESTKVLGSQDKGCILIKNNSQEDKSKAMKQEEKPGSSSSVSKMEPEVITIDDFIEDGWSSSSEDEVTVKQNTNIDKTSNGEAVNPKIETKSAPKSQIDFNEDEQLALAIQMSLIESKPENPHTVPSSESNANKEVSKLVNILEATGPEFLSSFAEGIDEEKVDETSEISYDTSERKFINKLESSQFSSCSKFLDTVGFSSKVSSIRSSPKSSSVVRMEKSRESASETSDSDFEAVEADDTSQEVNESERNLVNKLLEVTSLDKTSANNVPRSTHTSSTVATIALGDVVMTSPEDDMFADIFTNKEMEDVTPTSLHQIDTVDRENSKTVDENEDDGDTNWDSDPEVNLVSELESNFSTVSTTTAKNSTPSVPLPTRNLSQKEFLKELNQVSGSEEGTSSSATSLVSGNNQKITRTLGRMPTQARSSSGVKMITAEYMQAQDKLNTEQDKLQSARGNQERIATSISDQMNIETQELISLFGIPFVTSPTEAESQCAFLDTACLTEGTITDDSDIWMFGGQRVYKNFYASGDRRLEFYQLADIIKILNLDREKLVLMAMLMGGDYSLGVEGVGPVIALELLAEFQTNSIEAFDTLINLREWWDLAQTQKSVVAESKVKAKLRNLKLKPSFPNKAVYEAYMTPKIDTSTDPFRWGTPDLDAIRTYTKNKFGWEQSRCDSTLLPVLKNIKCQAEKSKQLTLDTYLTSSKFNLEKPYKRKKGSQRLHTAVKKLKGNLPNSELNLSSESSSEEEKEVVKPKNISPKKKSNTRTLQESPSKPPSQSTSKIILPKKNPTIPQKVQEETQRKINKQKAIEILKHKKVPK